MKKLFYQSLIFLLAFALMLAMPASASGIFTDVDDSTAYHTAIEYLYNEGIISGYKDENGFSFRAQDSISRAEFAKIIVVSTVDDMSQINENTVKFADMQAGCADQWAIPYIAYAVKNNIIFGYEDNTFRSSNSVLLCEAVKMVVCSLGLETKATDGPWYEPYMTAANDANLLDQISMDAQSVATRGIIAQIMYNALSDNAGFDDFDIKDADNVKICFPGYLQKAVTFSFDDHIPDDEAVIAILDKYGLKGTFNLQTNKFAGKDNVKPITYERYKNHEVANHTRNHYKLYIPDKNDENYKDFNTVIDEISMGINDINDVFGYEPMGFVWPGNVPYSREDYSKILAKMQKLGIKYARSIKSTIGTENPYAMPDNWMKWDATCRIAHSNELGFDKYIDEFIALDTNGSLALLAAWGHANDFKDNDLEYFDKACAKAGACEELWKATNIQICQYDLAVKQLIADTKNQVIKNPSDINIYAIINDEQVIIPAKGEISFAK